MCESLLEQGLWRAISKVLVGVLAPEPKNTWYLQGEDREDEGSWCFPAAILNLATKTISNIWQMRKKSLQDQLSIIQDSVTHQLAEVFKYYYLTSSLKHFFQVISQKSTPGAISDKYLYIFYQHLLPAFTSTQGCPSGSLNYLQKHTSCNPNNIQESEFSSL